MIVVGVQKVFALSQSDYSIRIDERLVIDGRGRAKDTASFSPCHMNHSGRRANAGRHTQRRAGRVTFYTLRDVQVWAARWPWLSTSTKAALSMQANMRPGLRRLVRSCCSIMAAFTGREGNTCCRTDEVSSLARQSHTLGWN